MGFYLTGGRWNLLTKKCQYRSTRSYIHHIILPPYFTFLFIFVLKVFIKITKLSARYSAFWRSKQHFSDKIAWNLTFVTLTGYVNIHILEHFNRILWPHFFKVFGQETSSQIFFEVCVHFKYKNIENFFRNTSYKLNSYNCCNFIWRRFRRPELETKVKSQVKMPKCELKLKLF